VPRVNLSSQVFVCDVTHICLIYSLSYTKKFKIPTSSMLHIVGRETFYFIFSCQVPYFYKCFKPLPHFVFIGVPLMIIIDLLIGFIVEVTWTQSVGLYKKKWPSYKSETQRIIRIIKIGTVSPNTTCEYVIAKELYSHSVP
jgi:hypothetical protein